MINLDSFEVTIPKAEDNSSNNKAGGVTIVYHKNGKRIVFSKRIFEILGFPEKVSFSLIKDYMIISTQNGRYKIKEMTKQKVIYNAELIKEILNYYHFEFDEHFCQTFSAIEEVDGIENAIAIKMCDTNGEQDENNHH